MLNDDLARPPRRAEKADVMFFGAPVDADEEQSGYGRFQSKATSKKMSRPYRAAHRPYTGTRSRAKAYGATSFGMLSSTVNPPGRMSYRGVETQGSAWRSRRVGRRP